MSKSLNKVTLIGNLGKDVVTNPTNNNGGIAANLTIATSESWKDKQTGNKVDSTEWHQVSAFGKLAEIMAQYLKKGSKVYIEGKLKTRKWTDKDGKDRWTTEIVANEMLMLDPPVNKQGYQQPANQNYQQNAVPNNGQQPANQGYQQNAAPNNGQQPANQGYQQNAAPNNGQQPANQGYQQNAAPNNGQQPGNQGYQNAPQNNDFGAAEDIPFMRIQENIALIS